MSVDEPELPDLSVSHEDRLGAPHSAEDTVRTRAETARQVFARPRPRRNLIIAVAVVIVVLVTGVHWLLSGRHHDTATQTASLVPVTPIASTVAGTSNNPQYNKLVNEDNANKAAAAASTGASSVPVLSNPGTSSSVLSLPSAPAAPATVSATSPPAANSMADAAAATPLPPTQTQRAMASAVQDQIQFYLSTWKPPGSSAEFDAYGKHAHAVAQVATAAPADGIARAAAGARFVQAGTVVPAELLTPINSDHPGPVLAQIISGPLAGSRVMGSFLTSNNRVVVTFTTIAIPGSSKSYTIRALAVNAATASTALATNVNNHYLEKYGLMLASSFVSGYGQAVANQGAVVTVSPLGGYTVANQGLNSHQILMSALGNVGTQVGDVAQANAETIKPTVRVAGRHGGPYPVGLLFMQDF